MIKIDRFLLNDVIFKAGLDPDEDLRERMVWYGDTTTLAIRIGGDRDSYLILLAIAEYSEDGGGFEMARKLADLAVTEALGTYTYLYLPGVEIVG